VSTSFRLIVALAALGLSGCTSVQSFRGLSLSGESLYVSGLPPLRQNQTYACGPACVAAVAAHWGVGLAEFKAKCPAAPQDTTGPDLRAIAESLGLRGLVYRGSLADLQDNLRQGRPVIVMIPQPPNPALRQAGFIGALALSVSEHVPHPSHWVVVIGFTGDHQVIVHDPAAGPLQLKADVFAQWWRRMNNLCVLIVPG
jgi:predicted double-glycine peptidase